MSKVYAITPGIGSKTSDFLARWGLDQSSFTSLKKRIFVQKGLVMGASSTTYLCEFTPEQMRVIRVALDCFSRIGMGQLSAAVDHLSQNNRLSSKNVNDLREQLKQLEPLATGLPYTGHLGITNSTIGEDHKMAWDIMQTLRHCQAWEEHPGGGWSVDFDKPMKTSTCPLPKVQVK